MEALECITTRMSIRKFKTDPVPREIIEEIIRTAQRSPSYKNGQPWEVAVLSGRRKEELSEKLVALVEKGISPQPDIPEPVRWSPGVSAKMNDHMDKRAKLFGVDFSDPALVIKSKKANFRFYGAPHGIFLYQDSELPQWSIFDMGLFAQSLMLAAHAKGVATVPQAFLIDYSPVIRDFLGLADRKRLILGMSMGYPDIEGGAMQYRSERIATEDMLKWVE